MENTKDIYAAAYKEVITILSFLSDDDWNKIPSEKRDFYFNNMDRNYNFKINYSKPIFEQTLLTETKAILANLFKNYLASPKQKQEIISRENKEFKEIENKKRELCNPDDLFKDKNTTVCVNPSNNLPALVEKESFFKRLIRKIKNLFK